MKELSLIQEYFVCAVNEKGKLSAFSMERQVCLVAAGLLELKLEGCIGIENKKAAVTGELPEDRGYLKPLYDYLNQGKPVKLEKVVSDYNGSMTGRRMNELVDAVGGWLAGEGAVQAEQAGMFDGCQRYVPDRYALERTIEKLRAELLGEGELSGDTAALVLLLEKGKCLKDYFPRYEQKQMRERLAAVMSSEDGRLVKRLVESTDDNLVITIATLVSDFM